MDLDKHHHNETKHKNQGQMPADQTHPMPMNLCSKKHAKKSIESMSFVEKLYDILSDPENMHIICWMPHGRSWKILCNDLLAREVCPKYFNHSNFASFNRQVNGWGFKRFKRVGPDRRSYYDQYFLRGRPDLIHMMSRPKPNSGRRLSDVANEPDFYAVSKKYPLPDGPNSSAKITAGSRNFDRKGSTMQDFSPPRVRPVDPPIASQPNNNRIAQRAIPEPSAVAIAAAPTMMHPPAFGPYSNMPPSPWVLPQFNVAPPAPYTPLLPHQFPMMPAFWQGFPPPPPPPNPYHPAMNGMVAQPSMAMQMNYQHHAAAFHHNYPPQLYSNAQFHGGNLNHNYPLHLHPHPNAAAPITMKPEVAASWNPKKNDANNDTTSR